jgi:hypothetical protein
MAGKHRREPEHQGVMKRVATAAVLVSLTFSLVGATSIDTSKAAVAAFRPEPIVAEPPVPPVEPVIVAIPQTVEPTPEPVAVEAETTTEPTPEPEPEPEPEVETVSEALNLSDYSSSGFNGVRPHVARAGHLIGDLFGVSNIGGVAGRANASDHPRGLALDFMCNRVTGDLIADYVLSHMDELNVKYVIWRQRINHGSGWEGMEDRGGDTANHYDHVHVSFNS